MRSRVARIALAAALVCVPATAVRAQDASRGGEAVVWNDGGKVRTRTAVTIESAGYDEVVVSQGGRRTTIPGVDVVEVRFGDAPREFDEALAALRGGDAAGAVRGF